MEGRFFSGFNSLFIDFFLEFFLWGVVYFIRGMLINFIFVVGIDNNIIVCRFGVGVWTFRLWDYRKRSFMFSDCRRLI